MENPKIQELRTYFNTLDTATASTLDRLEVLMETLRTLIPGFDAAYQKQTERQAERRTEQRSSRGAPSPQARHQPIDLLQDLFGKE
jgi:hypothetical protein